MRKMVFGRKLSRARKSRKALFRSLIRALILYGKIQTTKAKAKAIKGQIDKLVRLAQDNSITSRRKVLGFLGNDRKTVDIFFQKIVPNFSQRKSGFTRIILLSQRLGDKAEMARLEWTDEIGEVSQAGKVSKVPQGEKRSNRVEGKSKKKSVKSVKKSV